MTLCEFQSELVDGSAYRHTCVRQGCGQVFVTGAPRKRTRCRIQLEASANQLESEGNVNGAARVRTPSIARRALSFVSAEARWIAAGKPERSPERVAEIYAICRECQYFAPGASDDEGACRICGCQLKRFGGLLNKIRMATEGCPDSPPKWKSEGV